MKKSRRSIALTVGGILLFCLLFFIPRGPGFAFGLPLFLGLFLALLLQTAPLALPLFIMMRFLRAFPRPAVRPTWLQLGLIMGAVLSVYSAAFAVAQALLPLPPQFQYDFTYNPANVGSVGMFLLVGTVGVIGGYISGSK